MKNLIEKYFEGETTLQEEAELRSYFSSDDIDPALLPYQPLFRHFQHEREQTVSPEFDQKLNARLTATPKIVSMRKQRRNLLRIAAVGAVLLGAFFFLQRPIEPTSPQAINWEKYEITDEQAAYEETVKALKLLSSKLNKGTNKTVKEVEKIEKVSKYLN